MEGIKSVIDTKLKLRTLQSDDIFTIPLHQLIYLPYETINFQIVRVYKRRLIPKKWYKKLAFWKWIKKQCLVEVKIVS